ncbi:MAG: HAD family phosphatase [Clostridiales bacterium]|nr:HAD family phosphatase [Clostridiales bacterium]
MIKLIASDMDGTLLDSNHGITKENLLLINKAKENSIIFTIATGRRYEDVLPILKENNIKCQCIVMNGAEYRDEEGKILDSIYLSKEKSREILEVLKEHGFNIEIYTDKGLYCTTSKEEALNQAALRIMSYSSNNISFEKALKEAHNHPHFKELNYITNVEEFLESNIEIAKFVVFFDTIEKTKYAKNALKDIEGIAVSGSFERNIEINNIKAQKGIILTKVIKKMGLNKDEVAVMGDSYNDYSMFKEFTETYAMGNAIKEIKEIAKYITETNDNSGVAKAIEKIISSNKR